MHSVPSWAVALDRPSAPRVPSDEATQVRKYLFRVVRNLESNVSSGSKVDLRDKTLPQLWIRCLGSALTHNTRCRTLKLSGCKIDDDQVRLLCSSMRKWSSLRHLALDNNLITCKGAHAIFTQLSSAPLGGLMLEVCDLSFNRIGDSGARRIALTLTQHNSPVGQGLRVLLLKGNRIGDWGAGWLSLVIRNTGIGGCALEVLDVSNNPSISLSGGLSELTMACRQAHQTLELDAVAISVGSGRLTVRVSLERPMDETETADQARILRASPSRGLIGLSDGSIGSMLSPS
ncbi:hypothetical protein FOL47_010121 [Perkinsus chesapeaki]|uniref:Uncharacterized protein n=1 Tax=Perkinsus chesapeaki TaxID=330153 RepID=A0A7J6L3F0_PERCH|nr:hypothetical protein FOL47_010121 [Perkinsus chesapeaki]